MHHLCKPIPTIIPGTVSGRYEEIIREWYLDAISEEQPRELRIAVLRLLALHGYAKCEQDYVLVDKRVKYARYYLRHRIVEIFKVK